MLEEVHRKPRSAWLEGIPQPRVHFVVDLLSSIRWRSNELHFTDVRRPRRRRNSAPIRHGKYTPRNPPMHRTSAPNAKAQPKVEGQIDHSNLSGTAVRAVIFTTMHLALSKPLTHNNDAAPPQTTLSANNNGATSTNGP